MCDTGKCPAEKKIRELMKKIKATKGGKAMPKPRPTKGG